MVKSIKEAVRRMMQGHVQHYATPERKERRALVKTMGRRQAVSHVKGLRSLARVEARIEQLAKSMGGEA
jgi:hypothetical protein